ncbi:MAG: hypothetical protein KatS3mg003_0721 [Candidatus Nitrosocaldaceae archaeon]|nr:MAG: hypothetical protein KatS3mg003_0721 [Candidatus Nitrosocaldaceae archaeon]
MGRGRCIISDKDLVILDLLYKHKELRLIAIADMLNTKLPIIRDNITRLKGLRLIDKRAKVEKSGVGSYYHLTEEGKVVYNILKSKDDSIGKFLTYLNSIDDQIIKELASYLEENKDKMIIFDNKDYDDKEFVIKAYEELKKDNGEHFIAYTKGVEEDTLRVRIDDKEWHDLMITYITEYGNTRVIVNCSFADILTMVKDKLGFSDPNIFINEMIRLRHAITRVNHNLALPFAIGKDRFIVIGFKDKGVFVNDRRAAELLEEYFKKVWRDAVEFKELDEYLKDDDRYISECIANYIEGTAYADDNKLLYAIADRLKSSEKVIVRDEEIINVYKEIEGLQYIIIDKNGKMLDISIDYALSKGNTKILTNGDKIYINTRRIDKPLISAVISNNFIIIPYRDRAIISNDPILIDLLKEYFLTLWSNANDIEFRKVDEEELDKMINDAKERLKSIGIT